MSTTTLPRPARPTRPTRPSRTGRFWSGGGVGSLVRGRAEDPAWARPALIGLLVATAVAYLWNLTASGDANSFYAAAVQAGTKSWKALFFGSLDSSNFITVDKPPASLWVMALSGRIFGFSSASMLVPQVLEGVLAVGLLAASVKRWFGAGAGLLAGAMLAVTPVAALMFRFNNPDALLVCLLVASAYCLVRGLERGSTRWMVGVGTLIGFAFLAKMMQAFLVVPGFALVYFVAAPTSVRRRLADLIAGGAALLVSAGWWVAIVALWPASSRPMIDGSSDNSILNLIIGYNGLGRLTGSGGGAGAGAGGGGGGGGNFSGEPGVLRLFNALMGGQASWLLPAALLVVLAGLAWRLRAPRTDRTRAAIMLWGRWLVVSGLVFSLSAGGRIQLVVATLDDEELRCREEMPLLLVLLRRGRVSAVVRRRATGSIVFGSGKRSLEVPRARTLRSRRVCCRALVSGGFVRVAACRHCLSRRCPGAICPSLSEKRSRCCSPAVLGSGKSRVGSVGRRRPSPESCSATLRSDAAELNIERRPLRGTRSAAPVDPSRPSS